MHPPLIIVSGPSGSGKSTLVKRVIARWPDRLRLAVSATTRSARPGEVDGKDYYFWSRDRFERAIEAGEFLEYAEVHRQNYYGTPRAEVERAWAEGKGVFLDIDVQGAASVRAVYPEHLSVFVKLPALWVYCRRLEERGEKQENIVRRLQTAVGELERMKEYQHEIVNDDLQRATDDLAKLVSARFPGGLPEPAESQTE